MSGYNLIIRTADRTRKAEISVSPEQRISEIIQAAIDNWKLPTDVEYTIVNTSSGKRLDDTKTLSQAEVSAGDTLEIQPVLVAGGIG